ncbi:MAG TPA: class I SAM-dependent methyltransferase [Acetobacteraceae bacterium]|nr:class I SAM-dependent methyltransferase [Acetobacteraceae bacterium]
MLAEYYRKRAAEYDAFYADPARQADLAVLRDWLAGLTRGRRILEVAAGTGYWTATAAPVAAAITATDINAETLAIAGNRQPGAHVTLLRADAWNLPLLPERFDLGMAHLWWSHLRKRDRAAFLARFATHLEPGATLLMIDETLVANVGAPISRRDADGDTWQRRWLANGERFEIVKNYPDAAELAQSVGEACEDVRVLELKHFWALSAKFLPHPLPRSAREGVGRGCTVRPI